MSLATFFEVLAAEVEVRRSCRHHLAQTPPAAVHPPKLLPGFLETVAAPARPEEVLLPPLPEAEVEVDQLVSHLEEVLLEVGFSPPTLNLGQGQHLQPIEGDWADVQAGADHLAKRCHAPSQVELKRNDDGRSNRSNSVVDCEFDPQGCLRQELRDAEDHGTYTTSRGSAPR